MPVLKKLISVVDRTDLNTGLSMAIDKPYLLLLTSTDCDDQEFTSGEWIALRGRKEVYDHVMSYIINGNYVIVKSYVLSGGITFGNEVNLYSFIRLCIEKYQYGTSEDLAYLDQMTIDTANMIDMSITPEELSLMYRQEMSQSSR